MFNHVSSQRKVPEELVQIGKAQINEVLMGVSGVHFVMLCSSDGFELATVYKKEIQNRSKIAAVSSSILAMVAAFINEIKLDGCQTITLDAENGKVVLSTVSTANHPMIIVTMSAKDVLLGSLLHAVKRASENIAKADQP